MKNKEIISGVVGASFFALGYLGLSIAVVPSLLIGSGAYIASELMMSSKKKNEVIDKNKTLSDKLEDAKKYNKHINEMIKEIDDDILIEHLKSINVTTSKIIRTIEKNKIDNKNSNKFLDYYLPVCVNIIDRYDEIENQHLTSKDSAKFMKNSSKIFDETDSAFKKILNSLYQDDIENNEAEMKVFNQMLKSDGYNSNELELKDGDDDE